MRPWSLYFIGKEIFHSPVLCRMNLGVGKSSDRTGHSRFCKQKLNKFHTFLLALSSCDIDSFPNIHQLLVIACTLPITSSEAECSFSLLRRIKTCMRSTMTEERMADLGVIAMQYNERISIDDLCHAFFQAHPRRLFQASLFED